MLATLTGEMEKEIRKICGLKDIPLKKVPQIKLDKLTHNRNHQGIVAMTSLLRYQEIEDVIPMVYDRGEVPICVLLDNVTDVRNIGAIARSIEAMGAHALILSGKNAGMINEDSVKASAGAILNITICREKNTIEALQKMQAFGLISVGTVLGAPTMLDDLDLTVPLCLILGSEGHGLDHTVIAACDHTAQIPQNGPTNSLNVSVASGICMYEILRQRK